MEQSELESKEVECYKDQLQEIIKPYQQEQNRRQKKSEDIAYPIGSLDQE